jgi:probable addiction module antidote protein
MAGAIHETAVVSEIMKNSLAAGIKPALYFEACLEEDPGDGSLIRAALGDIARARGMSQLARETGLTREVTVHRPAEKGAFPSNCNRLAVLQMCASRTASYTGRM